LVEIVPKTNYHIFMDHTADEMPSYSKLQPQLMELNSDEFWLTFTTIPTDLWPAVRPASVSAALSSAKPHPVLLHAEPSAGRDGFAVLQSQQGVIHAIDTVLLLSPSPVQWLSAAQQSATPIPFCKRHSNE